MTDSSRLINCIAIDDEPLAITLISSYINQLSFLNLKGCYSSAIEALNVIRTEDIQLVFLDINMPDLNGIELAKIIAASQSNNTQIIFTTGYDRYAVESYKVGALDYLLKPFDFASFLRSVSRAQQYFNHHSQPLPAEIPVPLPKNVDPEYIFLKVEYQLVKVRLTDILYIEALKDYVKVQLKDRLKPIITLTSLKRLEEKLPSHCFLRIHRSYIVSLDKIDAISKNAITIENCTIPVTRQYHDNFQSYLANWKY
jgi:two-component system response regulator LytT